MSLPMRTNQHGFSLVELMVALAVGLILVAGLALLFANSSQSSAEFDKSVRQIENGRFAVDALAEDISVAGYFDAAAATTHGSAGGACDTGTVLAARLDAMRSSTPASLPFPIEGLTAVQAAALSCLPHYKPGTPALILRRLDTAALETGSVTTSDLLYMQASHNPSDINATYLVSANPATLVLKAKNGSPNTVRRYLSRIYYVASCSDCGQDTIPTLKRAELRGAAFAVAPLAEGIDQIGFDYGFDTDNNGSPDQWLGLNAATSDTAPAVALGWGNVVAVRVHVVSRTTETSAGFNDARSYSVGQDGTATLTVGPFNDAFKRRAYTSTARLNSVAGNRERP